VQYRRWIGEPAGLDHHAFEPRGGGRIAPPQQVFQRPLEVAAHGTAQASCL
jgi:hypothetical protein